VAYQVRQYLGRKGKAEAAEAKLEAAGWESETECAAGLIQNAWLLHAAWERRKWLKADEECRFLAQSDVEQWRLKGALLAQKHYQGHATRRLNSARAERAAAYKRAVGARETLRELSAAKVQAQYVYRSRSIYSM
jgi:hypothetical protein